MKKEYNFSKGIRGKFHNHDGEFVMPERDMLPLYEFQLRMATAKRDNAMAHTRELIERSRKWIDEVTFDQLSSEELNERANDE